MVDRVATKGEEKEHESGVAARIRTAATTPAGTGTLTIAERWRGGGGGGRAYNINRDHTTKVLLNLVCVLCLRNENFTTAARVLQQCRLNND